MPSHTYKVLLDSSAILSAFKSRTGGSYAIIDNLSKAKNMVFMTTFEAFLEVLSKAEKFETIPLILSNWVLSKGIRIVDSEPSVDDKQLALHTNDPDDTHLLRVARDERVDVLLTLEKKHLLTDAVREYLSPILVLSPKEFLWLRPFKL